MAPVVLKLAQTPGIESFVCVTAQHRQMLDQVLNLFGITPDVDLDLMRPDQSLAQISAAIFEHLDPVMKRYKPDWVLAQGDTTTVMAVALLAYFNRIRFGHVEAGLRTGDKWQPFPEEINRRVAGVTADVHFAPTEWSRQNLLRENIPSEQIVVTGNPVIDALQMVVQQPVSPEAVEIARQVGLEQSPAPRLILVTAHRRENFGAPLESICEALKAISAHYTGSVKIVYPVHLNPHVQGPVRRLLADDPNISLLPPLDYLPLVNLMQRATLVLTDSGGIQEEAPGLGVPVLVLRDVTERPEGVQAGTVRLVGTSKEGILREVQLLLDNPLEYQSMSKAQNPYGDGHASQRIIEALLSRGLLAD